MIENNLNMKMAHRPLKSLLSISDHLYEAFYAPLYLNLENWLEKNMPGTSLEAQRIRLEFLWQYGINALKIRRGYLLPFGSDAETCYREQEVWSYAVFTAALCYRTASHFHPANADWYKAIFPPAGIQWLEAYPAIFQSWNVYVQQGDNSTAFYQVERRLKRAEQHKEAKLKAVNTSSE